MTWKWWKNKKIKKDKRKGKKERTKIQPQGAEKSNGKESSTEEPAIVLGLPARSPPLSAPAQLPNSRRITGCVPAPQPLAQSLPPSAYILNLPSPLLHHIITTHLEPSCAILLSITCRTIYNLTREVIPTLYGCLGTLEEKIAILRLFPPHWPSIYSSFSNDISSSPTRCRTKERAPPILCIPCRIYHSSEHLLMYPHPRPEASFLSYTDFAVQKPRVCVRNAMRSGRWTAGADMGDGEHELCAECLTPRAKSCGLCAWNCMSCPCCTGRADWGLRCVICTGDDERDRDGGAVGFQKSRDAVNELWLRRPFEKDIVNSEPLVGRLWKPWTINTALVGIGSETGKAKTCGNCLGIIGFAEELHDLCRCGEQSPGSSDR